MAKSSNEPERPRAEPEIIPPDRNQTRPSGWPPYGFRQSADTQSAGVHRVYVGRIGPIGFALLMLVIGLFAGGLGPIAPKFRKRCRRQSGACRRNKIEPS
jgi:hypothetical protein